MSAPDRKISPAGYPFCLIDWRPTGRANGPAAKASVVDYRPTITSFASWGHGA